MCIDLPAIVADEAMVKAATISGVRYGPTDLQAPREFYRFEWEHERELWIGCLLSERVKRVRGGTITLEVLCPLGTLTPETLRRVVQYLREGTQPECDPELLESLRGTPLAEVDVFLEGLTVTHTLAAQFEMTGSESTDASHERYAAMVSTAISRVGYAVMQQPASQPEAPENLLVLRRAGQLRRYEVLCAIPIDSPLRTRGDSTLSQRLISFVVRCPDGTLRLYTRGDIDSVSERLACCRPLDEGSLAQEHGRQQLVLRQTRAHISEFDASGLTTVAYSTRPLSSFFFDGWFQRYLDVVTTGASDTEGSVLDQLECGASFLGSCAVEIPLRHGVSQAVRTFQQCNVPLCLASQLPYEPTVNIAQRSGITVGEADHPNTILLGLTVSTSPLFLAVLREMQESIESQSGGEMPSLVPLPRLDRNVVLASWARKLRHRGHSMFQRMG